MAPLKNRNAGAFPPWLSKRSHFFRVLIPSPFLKLHIPQNFMKHLDGEQYKKATLLSPLGKFWNIDLHKEGNDLYLDGGWSGFAVEHDLRTGYFVVFRYEGNMLFTVKVFDETCCLKEYELASCESPSRSSTSNESSGVACPTLRQISMHKDEAQCNNTPSSKKRKSVEISRQKITSPTTSPSKKSQNDLAEDSPSRLTETFTDGVPEGINGLAEDPVPKNIFQSKSRVEASILEATKKDNWMGNASCVRGNDGLENLGTKPDQFLNQPNVFTNSNSQHYSIFKCATSADPAGTVSDNHTEGINDLSKASVPISRLEPYNVEVDTAPGTSGLCTHGPSGLDGTGVSCKGSLDKLHLTPTTRKSWPPRNIKSIAEKTVQNVEFTVSGTASDVTEAATANSDCNYLKSESNERLRDEEKSSSRGVTRKKIINDLHKRIFKGGLPDGTALAYQHRNKVILTGVKQGNAIKCDCHNHVLAPSKFEAHAGQGQRRHPYRNIYNSDGKSLHELSLELPGIPRSGTEERGKMFN